MGWAEVGCLSGHKASQQIVDADNQTVSSIRTPGLKQ